MAVNTHPGITITNWLLRFEKFWITRSKLIRIMLFPLANTSLILIFKFWALVSDWAIFLCLLLLTFFQQLHTFFQERRNESKERIDNDRIRLLQPFENIIKGKSKKLLEALQEVPDNPLRLLQKARGKLNFSNSCFSALEALHSELLDIAKSKFPDTNVNFRLNIMGPSPDNPSYFKALQRSTLETSGAGHSAKELCNLKVKDKKFVSSRLWNKESKFEIVADTIEREKQGQFAFVNDEQPNRLKSLLCYRIDDPGNSNDNCIGILSIDSDKKNFFPSETDNPNEYKYFLSLIESFERIIIYEYRFEEVVCHLDSLSDFKN